jgi:hypothetical protein
MKQTLANLSPQELQVKLEECYRQAEPFRREIIKLHERFCFPVYHLNPDNSISFSEHQFSENVESLLKYLHECIDMIYEPYV